MARGVREEGRGGGVARVTSGSGSNIFMSLVGVCLFGSLIIVDRQR